MTEKEKIINERMIQEIDEYGSDFFVIEKVSYEYVHNEKQKNFIIETYTKPFENGVSVGKRFNKSSTWINKRLKAWGVSIKSNNELQRTSSFNEDYFEDINTYEKAYWLGLIYADGTVTLNKKSKANKTVNRLKLALKRSDKDILITFTKALNGDVSKVKDYYSSVNGKKFPYSEVSFYSPKLTYDICKWGMFPSNNEQGYQKKELIRLPKIKEDLLPSFILGYFDGDGSLTRNRMNGEIIDTQHLTFKLFSNHTFCKQIKEYINEKCGLLLDEEKNIYKIKDKKYLHSLEIGGNHQVFKILELIYKDMPYSIQRKRSKYEAFVEYYTENNNVSKIYERPRHHFVRQHYKTNKLIYK